MVKEQPPKFSDITLVLAPRRQKGGIVGVKKHSSGIIKGAKHQPRRAFSTRNIHHTRKRVVS